MAEIAAPASALLIGRGVAADLIAVLVAVTSGEPRVLTIADQRALPSGPFQLAHRSLQSGLRAWVERQTRLPLGYIEQLYTFADRDRGGGEQPVISISYLGLTREQRASGEYEASWRSWYLYFPWEDHRLGAPALIADEFLPRLRAWSDAAGDQFLRQNRWQRAIITFGFEDRPWNEELVLQRYELLYEAGLITEATRGEQQGAFSNAMPNAGQAMVLDHRRILATGIARLRAKIKYHPVVFELMPETFTLLQLQRCVEALAGRLVHKQNFRRLIEQQELVEETGETSQDTGGRPAKLFRFRRDILAERAVAGTKLPISRA
ncbi:NUDIX hydrolase [Methylocapsa acidiphila]|uniref:NUDIX hydrolase n=1 Tax=Methylocapsa acidiphila TaxID=133552 RepID=UPI00047EFD60|nr:membrane protein [Methylocapsa acidiphila]